MALPVTDSAELAREFEAVGESLRLTTQELVQQLNTTGQPGAATCAAELADRIAEHLRLVALLAEVCAK